MRIEEQYEATLKDIEGAIVAVYRRHRELNDYAVQRALEAAVGRYKDLARGYAERPPKLTGLDVPVFDGIRGACDRWLGPDAPKPLQLDEILACLRRLLKSVEFWNREGGRQGYLDYVQQWVR